MTTAIREQSKFYSNLLVISQFTNEPNREISRGVFQNCGFAGKRFLFSPPLSPSIFFCSRSDFRAVARLETLATQAKDSMSRNGRRQGYFVACVQPPPPLRKRILAIWAAEYYGSPVKIAFRRV